MSKQESDFGDDSTGIESAGTQSSASTTVAGETAEETREEWTEFEFEGDAKLSVEDLNVWYG
ncbi:phosphate ABC transporter ATP-binding protein, partial [Halorubellus litoreus]